MIKAVTLILFGAAVSCSNSNNKEYTSPAGYDFNNPDIQTLTNDLREISGIAFHLSGDGKLYAVQDELGSIYEYNSGIDQFRTKKFGRKGDYEDLAIYKNTVIVLRSDGTTFTFPLQQFWSSAELVAKEYSGLVPKGEYEAMAVDHDKKEMVIICKQCREDKNRNKLSGYLFRITENSIEKKDDFTFDLIQLTQFITSGKRIGFKPGALAKNPFTGEWYIISSVNRLLVIAGSDWNVTEVHELNPGIFEQPEGIAFDKNRNLYISSEAGDKDKGTIVKFSYEHK